MLYQVSDNYAIPATGKKIRFEALEVFRMENGLIVEAWGYWPDMQIKEMLMNVGSLF